MSYLKEMAEQGYNPDTIGKFHYKMLPCLAKMLNIDTNDLIVDIGAAQGHCVIPLKRAGYNHIAIVDNDPYNFSLFQKEYQFDCYQCDVSKKPLPFESDTVKWIINFHLIEHLAEPHFFLQEAFRVLKHGGGIILVTPDWRKQFKTFYRDPTHIRPYDKESISRLFRMIGFKNVYTYSWGSVYGLGRLQAYRWFPQLGMIGRDLLAVGYK